MKHRRKCQLCKRSVGEFLFCSKCPVIMHKFCVRAEGWGDLDDRCLMRLPRAVLTLDVTRVISCVRLCADAWSVRAIEYLRTHTAVSYTHLRAHET